MRPDFAILIYPVISFDSSFAHKGSRNKLVGANASKENRFFSNELQVTANTPPTFLFMQEMISGACRKQYPVLPGMY